MSQAKINRQGRIQLGRGQSANRALARITEDFLKTLKGKRQSPGTVRKRRDSLRKLLLFLEARSVERFADVNGALLESFQGCLVEHDYSESEVESCLRAVRLLFRYLEDRNLIFDNPAERMKIPKARLTLGHVLTESEVNRLLAVPNLTTAQGLRDRALLETLYSTGMRRGEAAGLALHDVDLERATVRVKGKGRKERLIPLGKHAVKYLRLYLKEARPRLLPKLMPASDALWFDIRRQPMDGSTLCRAVGACARAAGVAADTHTLRRTCATVLLRGGAQPGVVARILGHSNLRSLSHYLRTTIGDIQKAHALANPGR